MLKQLRSQKLMKWLLKATLFLVIPSFVLFYGWSDLMPSGRGYGASTYAEFREPGMLNFWPFNTFEAIKQGDLLDAGDRLLQRRRMESALTGVPFPQSADIGMFSRAELLEEALNQRIILHYAAENGIRATKQECREAIQAQFPQNTKAIFKIVLMQQGLSEEQYLANLRKEIVNEKVASLFLNQTKTSEFEVWQEYSLQNEQIQFDYVKISGSDYREAVAVDENDLKTFYAENEEEYRVPVQRKRQYISVSRSQVDAETTISDDDARAYYNENRETNFLFWSGSRAKVRHILLKYPAFQLAMPDDELTSRSLAILTQARQEGVDFGALADVHTEDEDNVESIAGGPVTRKGGLIGWIDDGSRAEWGDVFVNAVLAVKTPGEVNDNFVSDSKGVHVFKVEEIEDPKPRPYELDVIDKARNAARLLKIAEGLVSRVEALEKAYGGSSMLPSIAASLGVEVQESDWLNIDDYVIDPALGSLASEDSYIDLLGKNDLSSVLRIASGAICLGPYEERASRIPDLSEVRDAVEQDYRDWKALEFAKAKSEEGAEKAKTLEDLQDWAQAEGFEAKTTEYFVRIDPPVEFFETIDDLPKLTYKTPIGAVRTASLSMFGEKVGWIVWRIRDVKDADVEKYHKEKARLRREMIFWKQWTLMDEWLSNARKKWGVKLQQEGREG